MRGAVFYCTKRRRSILPSEGRIARECDSLLGGAEWICGNAVGGDAATANTVQNFCVCGGRIGGAADELHVGHRAGAADPIFWWGISGGGVWKRRGAAACAAQTGGSAVVGGVWG